MLILGSGGAMFFWGKRSAFQTIRVKRPTVFSLPGFSTAPLGSGSQVEETERALALLRQYLQACRADAYFGFFLPCADILKPYLSLYPEDKTFLRQLVQQERCGASAGVNHPFAALAGGEALIRNLLLGSFFYETHLRWTSKATLVRGVDPLFPQLPQIYRQCGLLAALIHHEDALESLIDAPELFHWMAPNGDTIMVRRMLEPPRDTPLQERAEAALQAERAIFPDSKAALMLEMDGSIPPSSEWVGCSRELSRLEPSIQCVGTSAQRYFAYVDQTANAKNNPPLPTWGHDFASARAWLALARRDLKVASSMAETLLYEAEVWTTLAESIQIRLPRTPLNLAWRQLIFGQNRQAILGLENEISVIDLLDILRETLELAEGQRTTAIKAIANQVATAGKEAPYAALIFNPLPWPCDAVFSAPESLLGGIEEYALVDPLGGEILCEIETADLESKPGERQVTYLCRNLPAAGYFGVKRLEGAPGRAPYIKKAQSQPWLENDYLRVEIDPDRGGGIISLMDKETEREFISETASYPANVIAWMEENHANEPSGAPSLRLKELSSDTHADCQNFEGPVSSRLVIRSSGPGPCVRIQELRLYEGMPFVDCVTILQDYSTVGDGKRQGDNGANQDLFMALFPFALPGARPVFEDRFYAKAGRLTPTSFSSLRNREAGGVLESLDIGARWVDVSWTFLIRFMRGSTEIASLAVGPCGIVTPPGRYLDAQQNLAAFLARHGVTSTPRHTLDENGASLGAVHFCIGKREEHPAIQKLMEQIPEASTYYEQLMQQLGFVILVLPYSLGGDSPHRSALILIAGERETHIRQAIDEIMQSTVAHRWDCPASSLFLPSLLVMDDAGMALLSRAPAICGLDEEGVLGLGLMRSAPYASPSTQWPYDFAEQKSNVFLYRLFPHTGDWRHAEIPRRAMEYNHPPVAAPVEAHSGALPPRMTFLSLEPSNVLVSSIKSAGYEEAAAIRPMPNRNAVVVRMYEAHGEESNIWMECFHPIHKVKPVTVAEQPLPIKREVYREKQFVRGTIHANEISTLQLDLKPEIRVHSRPEVKLGPIRIPNRYWRHNAGYCPGEFMPLSITIQGAIRLEGHNHDATVHHLDLVVVNHSRSISLQGEAVLGAPHYIRVIPDRVSYRVEPGAFQVIPIRVVMIGPERVGYIRVCAEHDGRAVEDLYHIGPHPEFDLRMTLNMEGFHVHLRHPYPYSVAGTVHLVAPIEAWPQTLIGEHAIDVISPRQQDFEVTHGEEVTLTFPVSETVRIHQAASDCHWIVIKLVTHHTLRYYHIRLDGRDSEGLGRILLPPYVD